MGLSSGESYSAGQLVGPRCLGRVKRGGSASSMKDLLIFGALSGRRKQNLAGIVYSSRASIMSLLRTVPKSAGA